MIGTLFDAWLGIRTDGKTVTHGWFTDGLPGGLPVSYQQVIVFSAAAVLGYLTIGQLKKDIDDASAGVWSRK